MLKWPHYKSNLDDIKIEPGTRRLWSQHEVSDSEWEDHKYPGVQGDVNQEETRIWWNSQW